MFNSNLTHQMKEAHERCLHLANSEQLMGYTESSVVYREMAQEFNGLQSWVDYYEMELGKQHVGCKLPLHAADCDPLS